MENPAASVKKSVFCGVLSVDADTEYGETGKIVAASVAESATWGHMGVDADNIKQRGGGERESPVPEHENRTGV